MNVLIFGGTGLLGSAAAQIFIDRGHHVKTIALPPLPEGAYDDPDCPPWYRLSSTLSMLLMMDRGTTPVSRLDASCFSRRRAVSSMAARMDRVMVSA